MYASHRLFFPILFSQEEQVNLELMENTKALAQTIVNTSLLFKKISESLNPDRMRCFALQCVGFNSCDTRKVQSVGRGAINAREFFGHALKRFPS